MTFETGSPIILELAKQAILAKNTLNYIEIKTWYMEVD